MRHLKLITLSGIVFLGCLVMPSKALVGTPVRVRIQTTAQDKSANLRSQLSEVEAKQSELQTRLQKLEENLKPENIANSLAGIGSTRPEDLREQRRRQLEIERNGVRAQLDILAVSHSRLETAIAQADAEAYRQSAAPVTATTPSSTGIPVRGTSTSATDEATTPERRRRVRKKKTKKTRRLNHTQARLIA